MTRLPILGDADGASLDLAMQKQTFGASLDVPQGGAMPGSDQNLLLRPYRKRYVRLASWMARLPVSQAQLGVMVVVTIGAANVHGRLLMQGQLPAIAHQAGAGVAIDAGHTSLVVHVSGSMPHQPAIVQVTAIGLIQREIPIHFRQPGVGKGNTPGTGMAPEAVFITDADSQQRVSRIPLPPEMAAQAAPTPLHAGAACLPGRLVRPQMAAGAKLAQ
jgi:hypothetical protein